MCNFGIIFMASAEWVYDLSQHSLRIMSLQSLIGHSARACSSWSKLSLPRYSTCGWSTTNLDSVLSLLSSWARRLRARIAHSDGERCLRGALHRVDLIFHQLSCVGGGWGYYTKGTGGKTACSVSTTGSQVWTVTTEVVTRAMNI